MTETMRFAQVRAELARRAEVFEDPDAYLDGVDDALALLAPPGHGAEPAAREGRERSLRPVPPRRERAS